MRGVDVLAEISLGYHEIPLDRVVGTRTGARSNSFAGNFMPLLADDTEFAIKWKKVYESQLVEGIREPIKVYEYLGRYYALEGNKRISILKYVGAASVYGSVTRLLPEPRIRCAIRLLATTIMHRCHYYSAGFRLHCQERNRYFRPSAAAADRCLQEPDHFRAFAAAAGR